MKFVLNLFCFFDDIFFNSSSNICIKSEYFPLMFFFI